MRIIFMGTPDFAVPTLDALVAAGHNVVAAYSQPPRRAGRGKALTPSPVQCRAEQLGIEGRTPVSLKDAAVQAEFAALDADVAVVAAYGLLLPRAVLDAPRLGCLNVHGSLLPRWRGAAPIQRAILAGDAETGVGIMQMEAGLDTGPVRLEQRTWIGVRTAGELTEALAEIGAELMVKVLSDPDAYPPIAQSTEGVTYAPKIEKTEARLDFTLPAIDLERRVQAFAPAPGAFFEVKGERIRLIRSKAIDRWSGFHEVPGLLIDLHDAKTSWGKSDRPRSTFVVSCGEGYLLLNVLQRPGKSAMRAEDVFRGFESAIGQHIG